MVGLDGFVSAAFQPGGKNLNLRLGRQVISWGESTFIPSGINVINPVDLSKLRVPGSELKEAFIPTSGIWASQELTNSTTIEGFYLTNFDKIRLDPRGSYFSNNDAASDDADRVIVSFGRRRDQRTPPGNPVPPGIPVLSDTAAALYGAFDPAAQIWVPRSADHNPSDSGQYGVALRYLASELNETEFGFYYMNYHSRIPFFAGIKGTTTSVLTGGPLIAPICATAALRALCATGTATYYTEYPENIHLYGLSFNTAGPAGIALQGEYSYRPNQPVQLATAELILASLGLPNLITGFTQIPGAPAGATAAALVPDGSYIQGFRNAKMSQFQVTGTKSWPNVLRADQLIVVGEVGANYFHNLPSELKFSGPAAYLPATAFGAVVSSAFSTPDRGLLHELLVGLSPRRPARVQQPAPRRQRRPAHRLLARREGRGTQLQRGHQVRLLRRFVGLPAQVGRRRAVHELLRGPHVLRHRHAPAGQRRDAGAERELLLERQPAQGPRFLFAERELLVLSAARKP